MQWEDRFHQFKHPSPPTGSKKRTTAVGKEPQPQNPVAVAVLQKAPVSEAHGHQGLDLSTELAQSLIVGNDLVAQKMGIRSLDGIGGLQSGGKSLRRLDVSFNMLTTLGYTGLGEFLPSLKTLSCYSNRLVNLDGLRGLSRIETLRLQHNAIPELNDAFLSMRKLRELRLDYNAIQSIDNVLLSCSSLETLDLSSNRLTSCEGLSGLQSLASLRLAHNLIRSLLPLRALPSLTYLDVSYNKVNSLVGIQNLYPLEVLVVNDNLVKTLTIPQTFSRSRDKTLSVAASSTSSLGGVKSREGRAESAPPTTVLGMPRLTELHLANNLCTSLEGLDRLGVSLELLDLTGNNLEADEISFTLLFALKRLEKLKLAPIRKSDEDFVPQLTARLRTACPHLESFDSQIFVTASLPAAAGVEAGADFSSEDEDDDDDSTEEGAAATARGGGGEGGGGMAVAADNKHNERFHAPTLSLRHMKTAEEVLALENDFKSLLHSCKETLFTILLKPDDEAYLAPLPPRRRDVKVEAKKIVENDSIELAASLFHFSSVVPVEGFRDTLDHRGNLVRPSQLTTEDLPNGHEKVVLGTSLKKPFILRQVDSQQDAEPPLVHSPSSSSKGSSSKLDLKQRSVNPPVNSHLGSGLTLHGSRIRQKAPPATTKNDPILLEMLQRFVEVDASHTLQTLQQQANSMLPFRRTLSASNSRSELEEASAVSHASSTSESYSFLTAPPQEKTQTVMHQEHLTSPPLVQSTGGFSRFRGSVAGLDTRIKAVGITSSPATIDDPSTLSIDEALGSLRRRRRFSEPHVQQQQQQQQNQPQPQPNVDDSDDDEDHLGDE